MTSKTENTEIQTAEAGSLGEAPAMAAPAQDAPTLEDYRAEWGEWVAATTITVGGVPAIAEGGSVPKSHPLFGEWTEQGLVIPRQ